MASSSADFPSSFYCSSNSASAQVRPRKYGVFLNFRGKDTREGFVSFLYRDINRQGIHAYLDCVELEKGARFSTILDAIQDSNIAVVLFSKDYASSSFCLDELVKIMECRQTTGLQLLVVFYRVDPVDVENQTGCFSKAFKTHKKSCDKKKIAEWRTALQDAATVAGWDYNSKDIRSEADLVDKIVEDICKKLRHIYPSNDSKNLVGLPSRVKQIESRLCIGKVNVVRFVGIWGMGGIGKTTLARAIFDKYSSHFQSSYFLANVREIAEKSGLPKLKEELLASLLNEASMLTYSGSSSTFLMNKLRHRNVLIVLDDVDKFEQIEYLAGSPEWFGAGSRVIITSRDKQVLKNGVDRIYRVQQLGDQEALKLFSLYAFKQSNLLADRMELSNRVVKYAKGLPLALKVLGLFLRGKEEEVWESALHELQKTPNMQVTKVLQISYNGLDYTSAKEIFLHIACFFRGESKTDVERILDSCGFSAKSLLDHLNDRALIDLSDSKVEMHDLLQEMGRDIVKQEPVKEPGEHSRLWNPEDIRYVLEKGRGTNAIKGISLDMSRTNDLVCLDPTAFSNMDQVILLRFDFPYRWHKLSYSEFPKKVDFPRGLESLPEKLRYLRWDCYPLEALPSNVYSENLVELDICFSMIKSLWTGKQNLSSLRVLRVKECQHLIEMPDFSGARNLQIINFGGCERLQEVSQSIKHVKNLKELDLSWCEIESIPRTKALRSLTKLILLGCTALNNLSKLSRSIEELELESTSIEKVPDCSKLRSLKKLDLSACSKLKKFPELSMSVEELRVGGRDDCVYHLLEQSHKNLDLPRLQTLELIHWRELGNILESNLGQLQKLNLSQSSFEYIGRIKHLSCLESLVIIGCTRLKSLPELPLHLKHLEANHCTRLEEVTNSDFALVENLVNLLDFRVDFTFWNCHKLNWDARRNVSSHAQKIIWLFSQKAHDRLSKSDGRKDEVRFVYPGNEIPDWVDCRSTGSEITLELPRNLCDDRKFLGFVLCAIFDEEAVQLPERTVTNVSCECLFESNDVARNLKLDEVLLMLQTGPSGWAGAHVLLWYSTRLHQAIASGLGGEDYYKATFQFHQYSENETSEDWRGVTKCGVRLLYIDKKTRKRKRKRNRKNRPRDHIQ